MKTKRKFIATVAVVSLAAIALSVQSNSDDKKTAGFAALTLSNPFELALTNLAVKGLQDAGLNVLPTANADADAARQITDINNLIANGAQGIITAVVDSNAIIPALDAAAAKNVPVVVVDSPPAGGKVAMIVSVDNVAIGAQACKVVGDKLGGKGKVLSLMGALATTVGRERTSGFGDCIKANYPGITVIEEPTDWTAEKAATATQNVLTTTPDLSAIYMQSDTAFLAAAMSAQVSMGRAAKVGEAGHIFTVTIDGGGEALQALRDDKIDVVLSQPLDLYAKYGAEYLIGAMAGKTWAEGPTPHGSQIVKYQGNLMDMVPATVVTKENVDTPSLWGNQK